MSRKLLCLPLLFGSMALAQATRLNGPVAGAVFDPPARSIRWIAGTPGAAYLGAAIAEGVNIGAVSPDGTLAVAASGGSVRLLMIGGEALATPLETEAGAVSAIVWSQDSTAVVVYGGGMRIWRNLTGTPQRIDLAGAEEANWTALAVEPGADAVLASAERGLYRLSAAEARLVAAIESPSAIAFSPNGDAAYVTSRTRGEVLSIRNWRESAEVTRLAGGIDDPLALAIGGGQSLLVAGGASRSLIEVDIEGGSIRRQWELDFRPARIERLASGAFRLNDRANGEPLQVLTSGANPAVRFIPALQ